MTRKQLFSRMRILALALALALLLPAGGASAYVIWIGGSTGWPRYVPIYLITCNDGYTVTLELGMNLVDAMVLAENVHCVGHGGVADVTDTSVTTALQQLASLSGPSDVSIGQDIGGGQYQPLTLAELRAIAEATGPNGTPLQGYEVLSTRIGGIELRSTAQVLASTLPLYEIYSNEDDTGLAVGGVVTVRVPVGGWVPGAVGAALLALGVGALRRPTW